MTAVGLFLLLSAPSAASDGATTFAIYCAGCHGAEGRGDGPAGKVMDPRPANFTDPAFWSERDDERLRKAIVEGGPAVGRSALMAGFDGRLDEAQVTAVVTFLRERFAPAPTEPPMDPPSAPDPSSEEPEPE